MKKTRRSLIFLIALFPASRFKNLIMNLLKLNIHASAKFGPNIIIGNCKITIGEGSLVRPFNIFRNVDLRMGNEAIIGSWNWFSAAPALNKHSLFKGEMILGDSVAINSRNYFDCSGGISFGAFSDLAGVRSTFITHFIDTSINKQVCKPIRIGERTMLSSNVTVAPGAVVGAKSIVAMGSVLIADEYPSGCLIAGVPGKVKEPREGLWFNRVSGIVHADEKQSD
jgi:acetyltransferase-like isoleucine patch superfamily enzyme